MKSLFDEICETPKEWYKLNSEKEEVYYKFLSFSSKSGSTNYVDHFFIAEVHNKEGILINPKRHLGMAFLHNLKPLSEEDLPWNQKDEVTHESFFGENLRRVYNILIKGKNKPNLSA